MEIIQTLSDGEIINFYDWELTRNRPVPIHLIENIIPTISFLQTIRTVIGEKIKVTSCYRDEEANIKAGGKNDSLHLAFNAIDWRPAGCSEKDLKDIYWHIEEGDFNTTVTFKGKTITITPADLGLGLYSTFIHLDTRGLIGRSAPARWIGH